MSDDYFERGSKVVQSVRKVSQDIGGRVGTELFGPTPSDSRMQDIGKIISLIDGSLAPFRDQLAINLDVLSEDSALFGALLEETRRCSESTWAGVLSGGKQLKSDFMQEAVGAFNTAVSSAIERHGLLVEVERGGKGTQVEPQPDSLAEDIASSSELSGDLQQEPLEKDLERVETSPTDVEPVAHSRDEKQPEGVLVEARRREIQERGVGIQEVDEDVVMPQLGGVQLVFDLSAMQARTADLRARQNFALLQKLLGNPVLVVGVSGMQAEEVQALESGMERLLESPEGTRALIRSGGISLGEGLESRGVGGELAPVSQARELKVNPTLLVGALRQQIDLQAVSTILENLPPLQFQIASVASLEVLDISPTMSEREVLEHDEAGPDAGVIVPREVEHEASIDLGEGTVPKVLEADVVDIGALVEDSPVQAEGAQSTADDYFERGSKVVQSVRKMSQDIGRRIGTELFGPTPSDSRVQDIDKIISLIDGSLAPFRDQLSTDLDVLLADETLFDALLEETRGQTEDTRWGYWTGSGGKQLKKDFMQEAAEKFNAAVLAAIKSKGLLMETERGGEGTQVDPQPDVALVSSPDSSSAAEDVSLATPSDDQSRAEVLADAAQSDVVSQADTLEQSTEGVGHSEPVIEAASGIGQDRSEGKVAELEESAPPPVTPAQLQKMDEKFAQARQRRERRATDTEDLGHRAYTIDLKVCKNCSVLEEDTLFFNALEKVYGPELPIVFEGESIDSRGIQNIDPSALRELLEAHTDVQRILQKFKEPSSLSEPQQRQNLDETSIIIDSDIAQRVAAKHSTEVIASSQREFLSEQLEFRRQYSSPEARMLDEFTHIFFNDVSDIKDLDRNLKNENLVKRFADTMEILSGSKASADRDDYVEMATQLTEGFIKVIDDIGKQDKKSKPSHAIGKLAELFGKLVSKIKGKMHKGEGDPEIGVESELRKVFSTALVQGKRQQSKSGDFGMDDLRGILSGGARALEERSQAAVRAI